MKRNRPLIILVLLISLFNIRPIIVSNSTVESVVGHYVIEKQISAYSDDAFLFVNSYFTNSTTAIPLSNNQYDVMIGLRFQDVGINAPTSTTYETIETCRLSFYTTDDYPVQSGNTWLTIYGIKESGDVPTFSSYQDMVDREKYPNYNNVNFNELIGDGVWWNTTDIRVTTRNLVTGTERDIGFILYASSGGASRLFRTYEHNSSLSAKLYIMVFQWEIYDPTAQDEYVDTYRDIDIFGTKTGYPLEPIEFIYGLGESEPFEVRYENKYGLGSDLVNSTANLSPTWVNNQRALTRVSNGSLYAVYEGELGEVTQVFMKRSFNDGENWSNEVRVSTSEGMESTDHVEPAIAVDLFDGLHVVWFCGAVPYQEIWYSYFNTTKLTNSTWTTPIAISDLPTDYLQADPAIALDYYNNIHVVWRGKGTDFPQYEQIWYVNYTVSWSTPLRISTLPLMDDTHCLPSAIAIDSQNHIHLAWAHDGQIYYVERTTNWETIIKISTYTGMINYPHSTPSIAVDSEDNPYVTWAGKAGVPYAGDNQIWINNRTNDNWGYPQRVSIKSTMEDFTQQEPTIGLDSDDVIYIVWTGSNFTSPPEGLNKKIWLNNYTDGWNTPIRITHEGRNLYPNMRWAKFPLGNSTYYAVDINGTQVSPNFDTVEEVEDWIDNYLSHSGGGVGEGMGDLVIALMGLAGFIMIPLSFIIFIQNMQSGDVENAFYMLMVLFFMGIAFIANWLWG